MRPQKIEISYKTIVFTVLFLLSLALLWQIRAILALFFVCFIFMEAVNPAVARLEKMKIPRVLAIILIYLLILTTFTFGIAGIVPILIEQTTALIKALPDLIQKTTFWGTSAIDLSSQFKIIENLPSGIANTAISFVGNVFSGIVVMMITLYMLLERKNFSKYGEKLFGNVGKIKTVKILEQLQGRMGSWVSAEIILMTIIGLVSYLGYLFLGLKYAVPLAIIAGLLEIIPGIGPVVASVLAGIVGLLISPLTGLLAIIWGIIVQQLENNFLVPKVMKEAVGLNPLVTIFLLAVGASLGGVIGALLAIPIFLTIEVIVKVIREKA